MNNRFIYGILSIALAAIIAFIAIPAVTSRTRSTCGIVRMKAAVTRGTPITADDLEIVEVGGFNLPDSVARRIEDVAGTYAVNNFMSCHRFNLTCCRKITHFPVTQSIVYTTIYFQSTAALRTAFSMFLSYIV